MSRVRIFAAVLLILSVAGCAGRGAKTQLTRLQSQVGLLDERITQLERMGVSSTASTGSSTDAWASPTGSGDTTFKPSAASAAVSKGAVKVSTSNKPSTREIQSALKTAGFYQGNVDGKMGPLTRQAVEEFQRINGLSPDGVVGRQTWSKLKQYAELSGGDSATYSK